MNYSFPLLSLGKMAIDQRSLSSVYQAKAARFTRNVFTNSVRQAILQDYQSCNEPSPVPVVCMLGLPICSTPNTAISSDAPHHTKPSKGNLCASFSSSLSTELQRKHCTTTAEDRTSLPRLQQDRSESCRRLKSPADARAQHSSSEPGQQAQCPRKNRCDFPEEMTPVLLLYACSVGISFAHSSTVEPA